MSPGAQARSEQAVREQPEPDQAEPDRAEPVRMHAGQLLVEEATVRALVADQLPQWVDLPVGLLPQAGTVDAVAQLGEHLAARFPLQPGDPEAVRRTLEAAAAA